MPKQNGPGGPYIVTPPPPPPPVGLYGPDSVFETATEEQLARIAQLELAYAHRVSVLLSETYSELQAILRTEQR